MTRPPEKVKDKPDTTAGS